MSSTPRTQKSSVLLGALAILLGIAGIIGYGMGARSGSKGFRQGNPSGLYPTLGELDTDCPVCPTPPVYTLPDEYQQFYFFSIYLEKYKQVPTQVQLDTFRKTSSDEVTQERLKEFNEYLKRVQRGANEPFGSAFDWGHRALTYCNGRTGFFGTTARADYREPTDYGRRYTVSEVNRCIDPS